MKLIEYMPDFLKNIREFKEIFKAEDIEINNLKTHISNILKEVIITSSEAYGLDRYEKIYDVSSNTEDLEIRRFAILNKINNKSPHTLNWLINKLNSVVGIDNYVLDIDYNNYSVRVEILSSLQDVAVILNKDLREELPANLSVDVVLCQSEECKTYYAGFVQTGDYIEIRQVV